MAMPNLFIKENRPIWTVLGIAFVSILIGGLLKKEEPNG